VLGGLVWVFLKIIEFWPLSQQDFMVVRANIWIMSGSVVPVLAGCIVLVVLAACAGCTGTSVGDVGYSNHSLTVNVSNTGDPADVHIQATVYHITGLDQKVSVITGTDATLEAGLNHVVIPVELEPGQYKLYVYVLSNGDRKTAVIRDIRV
jgi:hypothetical protein